MALRSPGKSPSHYCPSHYLCAGLDQVDDQINKLSSHVLDRRLVQVVLARTSELLGKSVRETHFRSQFDAAIIALHREGQHRLRQTIGEIVLAVCFLPQPRLELVPINPGTLG